MRSSFKREIEFAGQGATLMPWRAGLKLVLTEGQASERQFLFYTEKIAIS